MNSIGMEYCSDNVTIKNYALWNRLIANGELVTEITLDEYSGLPLKHQKHASENTPLFA